VQKVLEMVVGMNDFLPHVLPVGWRIDHLRLDGALYVHEGRRLSVIVSTATELDAKKWLHVSVASPDKLPSWETLKQVKDIFVGRKLQAIQVLPSEEKYVNQHPNCLHLFCCLDDADPVPDFTRGGTSI
jgi:hypothetical protein